MIFNFNDRPTYTPPLGNAILFSFDLSYNITQTLKLGLTVNNDIKKLFIVSQKLTLTVSLINSIYKSIPGYGPTAILFNEPLAIEQIALTFDQLGRPLVFYRVGENTLKLYWYDPVAGASVTTVLAAGVDPQAGFDFPQDTGQSFSDALLFYVRNDTVYMRVQRDRFATEYVCPASEPGLTLISNGLRVDNRYQVVYEFQDNGYTPPIVPPPPVVIIQPGDPEPEPEPGEPPPIVIVDDYHYLNSWGSCLITNYRLDVVNDPFKLGFKVRDAFFPRYTENTNTQSPFKQGQYMFGSDGRRQFYCYIERDTRNNRGYINLWRGGDELSASFELDIFDGEWEFEFRGLNPIVTIKKDGLIIFDDWLARPRPNSAAPTLITFAGGLYQTNGIDTYPFHGVQYDCWIEHNGNRIDWAVQTRGEAVQPSVPAGTDMTIHNHRVQNWVRRD